MGGNDTNQEARRLQTRKDRFMMRVTGAGAPTRSPTNWTLSLLCRVPGTVPGTRDLAKKSRRVPGVTGGNLPPACCGP